MNKSKDDKEENDNTPPAPQWLTRSLIIKIVIWAVIYCICAKLGRPWVYTYKE